MVTRICMVLLLVSAQVPGLAVSSDKPHSQSPSNPSQWMSHQMNQPSRNTSDRYKISKDRINEIKMLLKEAEKELQAKKDQ